MIKCDGCGTDNPLGEGRPAGPGAAWPMNVAAPAVTGIPATHLCWDCLAEIMEYNTLLLRERLSARNKHGSARISKTHA